MTSENNIDDLYLPKNLYGANTVREIDRALIEGRGIAASTLMGRAGASAYALLRTRSPRIRAPIIVCGRGNNGGDGYVLARLLCEAGLAPSVMAVGEGTRSPAARDAAASCHAAGVSLIDFDREQLTRADMIVDALLGIGLTREVSGDMRIAIEAINAAHRPVLALDIPSGLDADTGVVRGVAVRAQATLSFIALKAGLFTGEGRDYSGEIFFDDLGASPDVYGSVTPRACRITAEAMRGLFRPRSRAAHKGNHGHVLVIGGDLGMAGAARLAGEAAYCAGAGLVTVATRPEHAASISAACPELLAYGVNGATDMRALVARADVIAIGPGLGRGSWGQAVLGAVWESRLPAVVDADALNLIALDPAQRSDWILTPHPGEAGRLLASDARTVQANRFDAARAINDRYGGVCVLKGSGTLIAARNEMALCDRGNPGMASGGTGDVLTGVIAALRAQGLSAFDAARLGVWAHAAAGDDAARAGGERGLRASDLLHFVRTRLNGIARDA